MKPIASITAMVSPVQMQLDSELASLPQQAPSSSSSSTPSTSSSPLVKDPSQAKNSTGRKTVGMGEATTNSTNPGNSSLSSAPRSQQFENIDRKLLNGKIREGTQLGNVFKISPLNMFANNKVSSSFRADQGNAIYGRDGTSLVNGMILPVTNRKVRDSGSLLLMLAFLSFLGYIIWDSIFVKEVDINLIVHGHDSYGNICGRNNKPISYAEKSGKNYTSKPYTKYTLINAQFERYTLDTDRLKQGELLYIKHLDDGDDTKELERSGVEYSAGDHTGSRKTTAVRGARLARGAQDVGPDLTQSFYENSRARNQTLLRQLKSQLMYQYPTTYQTKPLAESASTHKPPSAGGITAQDSVSANSNSNMQFNKSDGTVQAVYSGGSLKSHGTQSNASMYPVERLSQQASRRLKNTTSMTTITNIEDPTPTSLITLDDQASDSERYEHVMLNSTNQRRTSIIHGLDANEVSGQLFYLTECVDHCPSNHVELIFYRCMPRNWRFSLFPTAINVTQTFIDDIVTDMSHCYRELIYIFSLALFLSLALLILLRFLASLIIWSCLAMVISLIISLASYSWLNYYHQIVDLNHLMPHDSYYAERVATTDKWLVGSIFLTFVSFSIIGLVIFMRRRILLVTTLFRESGKAIADMPLLLLQPVLTFAALVLLTFLWGFGLICLQSVKNPVLDMQTNFIVFKSDVLYKVMKWYHIFAFLWVSHFAIACQHYVIGASVSKWYFSENRYALNSPIGSSVSELILYYLGSVALGSFLVAIFKVVRIISKQIQYLVQRNCMANSNAPNSLDSPEMNSSQLSSSCCGTFGYIWRLFIWFFDNIVMIINRDAYVEIAIHGHSFLSGAQRALKILASNPLKLLAIKSVSNILLIMAKICVVFGTISMAVVLLEEKNHQLNYSWSPIVVSAIYSYVVAHWFLSVYEMVIDALFICYCEDYERSKTQETINRISNSHMMAHILNSNQYF